MAAVKAEFQWKNFKLDHAQPDLLLTSRWHKPHIISKWYLAVRWILALYHLSWLIYNFVDYSHPKGFFFIYLTEWSFICLTSLTVVWCAVETLAYVKFVKEGYITKRVGWSLKLLWTLQNIVFMPAFLVSTIYWVVLYNDEGDAPPPDVTPPPHFSSTASPTSPPHSEGPSVSNIEVHGMNSVYCLIEIFLSATPLRLFHIYQPVIYLLIYVFFSLFYYLAGGTTPDGGHAIYPVLDWEKVGPTVAFIAVGAVLCFFLQVIVWSLSQAREAIYRKWVKQETTEEDLQLPN